MKHEKPYKRRFVCKIKFLFYKRSGRVCVKSYYVVRTGAEAEGSVVLFQEHRLAFSGVSTGKWALCVFGLREEVPFSGRGVRS